MSEIQEAIICIGFDAVRELALSQKVCELFQEDLTIDGYTRLSLWKHSVAVALTSQLIYRREFRERGDNVYVAGLLHDIGLIILDQFMHGDFSAILNKSRNERNNITFFEQARLGFSHPEIGGAITGNWELPDEICAAISGHHFPDAPDDSSGKIVSTLFVSDYAVQERSIGYCDAPYGNQTTYQKFLIRLGVKEKAIALIMKEVEQEIFKMENAGWF